MPVDGETRQCMASYWEQHKQTSVEMMMLDDNAAAIAEREALEIIQMLPPVAGCRVVELGAGIGRFTQHLAPKVASLHAIDFMQDFIDKNRELNGHHDNVEFSVADVTKLQLPAESSDIVFSNWLFMYLDDSEVQHVFNRILTWLRPGGYFFFRESCFHKSGSVKRDENPTRYRTPQKYNELVRQCAQDGHLYSILYNRPSRTYISFKQNRNQMCWLVQKVATCDRLQLQHEADSMFSEQNIHKLEDIFGKSFLSSGGIASTHELCRQLNVPRGSRVLDVGCGLGDTAIHLVQEYGAHVTGMDISGPMISLALQRANQQAVPNVIFEQADVQTYDLYEAGTFDVIYSRDVLQYVGEKNIVLAKFYKWLKPGGRLTISDYCVSSADQLHKNLDSFWSRRPHRLTSVDSYVRMLHSHKFVQLSVENITSSLQQISLRELQVLEENRQLFIDEFGEVSFELTNANWRRRLSMCMNGELQWTLFQFMKREE